MQAHHVDEISVWTWVATLAFVLIAVAAIFVGTQENLRVATGVNGSGLPMVEPGLLPPTVADPRA
jgi:hypothetical protein